MAGMLAEEDPASAWRHARAARSKGGRIAVVRETVGLVAYHAGEWAEAVAELRAARRMSGGPGQLPVMADCERALGHPEKAIEMSRSTEASELDPSSAAELRIVVAGARADLGQLDAALAHLESAVRPDVSEPYSARLFYAYADLLLQAGRRSEAVDFFMKAADADVEEDTDAGERLTELAGRETGEGAGEDAVDLDGDHTDGDDEDVQDPQAASLLTGGDQIDEADLGHQDGDLGENVEDVVGADGHEDSDYALNDMDVDDEDVAPDVDSSVGVFVAAPSSETEPSEIEQPGAPSPADPVDTDPVDEVRSSAADGTASDGTASEKKHVSSVDEPDTGQPDGVVLDPAPVRPATPPTSMSSLFSHNEGGL